MHYTVIRRYVTALQTNEITRVIAMAVFSNEQKVCFARDARRTRFFDIERS